MFLSCVRSYFSFMRGCSSPDLLCARAKALGYDSVALTDYNSLVGLWSFLRACDTYGLRPVIGAEISDGGGQESVFMLARDDGGYRNLCKVISARKKDRFFDLTSLAQMEGKGLVILSSSLVLLEAFKKSSAKLVVNLGNRPTEQGRTLRNWALENQLPAVMTSSAVMATAEEQDLYALLRAIGSNDRFVRNGRKKDHACWIESWQSYKERFAVWPEVLPATESLAGICLFNGPDFGLVMPPWDSATYSAKTFLRKKAYAGARIRYGDDLSEAVVERLEHELGIIDTMGFSSYFLVVHTIVEEHFKKRLKSVPRICGRGSGAASLVAYCLEITNVCPLKHNLYFERFLNPGRSDAPDIDIDFAWDERDLILERVLHGYAGHAAMVATIIRFQPRMALRETAKAFGIPAGEIASYSRMLRKKDISSSVLQSPWPEILHLAGQLVTIPRHLSVHPGGVVITPQPLDCYVPVELAAKGVPVIQWDKDDAEEAGLVKIDLLGNRSLGVIRDCINAIPSRKKNFDEQYWQPEDDPATKRAVATGKTMGCFYIESPAMRLLQQKAGSGEFAELVLQSSIIRPAANVFVREYVRRLHGAKWEHLHPALSDVLGETYGLMVYQEDVSRVAVAVAGFSHAQADGLRKVLSKKDKVLRLKDYRKRFDAGCQANRVPAETREKLWQMMMSFDGYSFCKAHSASYARVSYQAAFLKTHYPAEFMAAVISNRGGYYPTFAYVSEAKRLGLCILPPCVNRSMIRWQGRGREIRVGLIAIRDLSHESMQGIIQKRKEKAYSSSVDFWQRVPLQKDENRALIQSGALDAFATDHNRSRLFWDFAQFQNLSKLWKRSSLFGIRLPSAPELPDIPAHKRLQDEYRALGFLCGQHPLLLHGEKLRGRVKGVELAAKRGRRVAFAGWLISGKLVSTATGEVMEFLCFEDETALVETVFFPKVYRRYAQSLVTDRAYMLWGLVEEEFGAISLTVEKLKPL